MKTPTEIIIEAGYDETDARLIIAALERNGYLFMQSTAYPHTTIEHEA